MIYEKSVYAEKTVPAEISTVTDAEIIMEKYESAPKLRAKMIHTLARKLGLRYDRFCTFLAI